MAGYDSKSCTALQTFYRPIEAAIHWCGLTEHEAAIMVAMDRSGSRGEPSRQV